MSKLVLKKRTIHNRHTLFRNIQINRAWNENTDINVCKRLNVQNYSKKAFEKRFSWASSWCEKIYPASMSRPFSYSKGIILCSFHARKKLQKYFCLKFEIIAHTNLSHADVSFQIYNHYIHSQVETLILVQCGWQTAFYGLFTLIETGAGTCTGKKETAAACRNVHIGLRQGQGPEPIVSCCVRISQYCTQSCVVWLYHKCTHELVTSRKVNVWIFWRVVLGIHVRDAMSWSDTR